MNLPSYKIIEFLQIPASGLEVELYHKNPDYLGVTSLCFLARGLEVIDAFSPPCSLSYELGINLCQSLGSSAAAATSARSSGRPARSPRIYTYTHKQ